VWDSSDDGVHRRVLVHVTAPVYKVRETEEEMSRTALQHMIGLEKRHRRGLGTVSKASGLCALRDGKMGVQPHGMKARHNADNILPMLDGMLYF